MPPSREREVEAQPVKEGQVNRCLVNTLGVCSFGTMGVSFDLMAETLSVATGEKYTAADLRREALRLLNLR